MSLKAEVTASFRLAGGGSIPLAIEGDPGLYADADVHLLLFPDVDATLAVNKDANGRDVGRVVKGGRRTVNVPAGVIQFSGSDTAQLPYLPVDSRPEFRALIAFDLKGQATSVRAFWDADTKAVRASRPFYGFLSYSPYSTTARMLSYTPQTLLGGRGSSTIYGTICAFYPPDSLTLYEVEPVVFDNGEALIELYRIISNSISTRDGEFEYPPGFPNDFAYPGKTLEVDTSLVAKNERVHEVGYMNPRGYAWVETKNVPVLEPYVGDLNYSPVKSKRVNTLDPKVYPYDVIAKAADFIKSRGLGNA